MYGCVGSRTLGHLAQADGAPGTPNDDVIVMNGPGWASSTRPLADRIWGGAVLRGVINKARHLASQ